MDAVKKSILLFLTGFFLSNHIFAQEDSLIISQPHLITDSSIK